MLRARLFVVLFVLLLAISAVGYAQEFRSIEITSWASGFESASACTTMVNYADSCNLNCVIPEIRLRCDAYYTSSIEPPGTGVVPSPPGFDSLADLISKAHPLGIEVNPWLVTWRIWTTVTGPPHMSPIEHIWWTHGPGNTDPDQDWLMYSDTGAWDYGGVSNLDPGVPAVEDYLISVFMEIVNGYDVDGLNLDYIRYPATNWGYNPVSVARFNAEYGRTGSPSSSDTTWLNWRRDQITNLVKRLYLEIKAVKPWVKLNADVWNSATTGNNSYLQNWDSWMLNHWMDFAHPMSYTSNNSTFNSWCAAYVGNQHGRHVYPLVDASNSITGNVLPQIDSARAYGFYGLGLYSYQSIPDKPGLQSALVNGPFPTQVATPDMPWLSSPTLGMLKGFIADGQGYAIYPATVTIQSKSTKNTGTGFYGFVDLNTGTYTVNVTAPGYLPNSGQVTIYAGQVSNLNITLGQDTTPPIISNVRTANVQATNAQVLWDTNEAATSQVEYGLTTSYGNLTTEDPALVTAHTVQLANLTANTLYHYRVKSKDAAGNPATSGDYTFTTTSGDVVADIIIDNPAATLVGSWSTGTSSTDKYGTDYYYCTTATSETKSARWTPTIITAGDYDVYVWYPQGSNRSVMAPYTVYWNGGSQTYSVNQTTGGGQWNLIASAKPFLVGTGGSIKLGNGTGESALNVMADAVKFVYAGGGGDTTPPVISNVGSNPADTTCTITWTTDEPATSQVEYGLTISYGTLTTLDPTLVTSHSVGLSGLTAGQLYHYRVRSKDAANNEGISGDYTFTTTGGSVADIIIDNPAATYTGSWTLGTSSVDKYGADYNWATTATSETATATWTPNILTAGNYNVYVWYPQGSNRSVMAPYTVYYNGGSVTVPVDQTAGGGQWNLIASAKPFLAGTGGSVKLGNGTGEASKVVMADAVKFVYGTGPSMTDYAPTAITLTRGTVTSGSVANLAANDASYLVISAQRVGGTRYVDWYSSVSIAEAPASVTKLTITFDGKLSTSLTQRLYLYNWSTSTWDQIDSRTVGTSDVTVGWDTTSPGNYISGTGQIRLRQYVTRGSSFTSSSDFTQFRVEF